MRSRVTALLCLLAFAGAEAAMLTPSASAAGCKSIYCIPLAKKKTAKRKKPAHRKAAPKHAARKPSAKRPAHKKRH